MYKTLKVRYKVGDAISEERGRLNGLIQGLSGSIMAATLMMAIWDRVIKETTKGVHTGGFVDDTNMSSKGETCVEELIEAWEATKKFDKAAGMETNKRKTKASANTEKLEKN